MSGSTTIIGSGGANPELIASRARHPTARPSSKKNLRKTEKRRAAARKASEARAAARAGIVSTAPPIQFYVIAAIMVVLTMLGLVMVLSSSAITSINRGQSGWTYFSKQMMWAAIGMVSLLVTVRVPYTVWRRYVRSGLLLSFIAMAAVFLPGLGRYVNGARAWLNLGPFGFQPSEAMKLALLVYTADLLARRADRINDPRVTLRPVLVVLGAAGVLVMAQRDLGSGIVMAVIVLSVAFFAGVPLRPLGAATIGMAAVAGFFIMSETYRRARWTSFLNLAANKQGSGYQVWQSLVAVASGGLTGAGIGAGKGKWGFLPEAHTDFIFAIIAEEMGLVGVVVVCGLFAALGYVGIQVALHAKDRFAMLLAGGVTAWLLVQAVINIMGVVGMMPLTGLTLPFVSFGGSSLLITMAAAGLLLNVARNSA